MSETITLTMGDWSCDGHGISRTEAIQSNLDKAGLEIAYKRGVELTGVDIAREVACEYEDNDFPIELIDKLRKFGFDPNEMLDTDYRDMSLKTVGYETFWLIWLFIAKVGNPDLVWTECERPKSNINIGGYGLFSH